MPNWIPFDGTAEQEKNYSVLTSTDGEVILEVPTDSVRVDNSRVEVAVGSSARIRKAPSTASCERPELTTSFFGPEECPRDYPHWGCYAFIAICCAGGKIIGGCIGYYPCP
ncbi:MAG: hypothetical protein N4J56_007336 [Chroococcidiopsis sp. SAG 2025]|nr:hypothetical protein [Chroococcidiopsis sp. SAG 2025]